MKIPMKFVEFPHEDTFDYDQPRSCRNCHEEFTGRYCNRCGERVIVPEERSLPVFFKRIFRTVPILDNKFTRTIRLMLTNPGFVARNYIEGRRIPFVDPLAIFLVINLLYFLFPTVQNFNSPLRTQMHFLMHAEVATEMVEARLSEDGTSIENFNVRYDLHAANVAKIMLVGFVLILTVPFWMVNYSSHLFFRDHLIVSMEFSSASVLLNSLAIPWTWVLIHSFFSEASSEPKVVSDNIYLSVTMGLASFGLFYLFERNVYGHSVRRSLVLALLMMTGLLVAIHLYYAVVFFVSMWTL
jgi:hypothetical protein